MRGRISAGPEGGLELVQAPAFGLELEGRDLIEGKELAAEIVLRGEAELVRNIFRRSPAHKHAPGDHHALATHPYLGRETYIAYENLV